MSRNKLILLLFTTSVIVSTAAVRNRTVFVFRQESDTPTDEYLIWNATDAKTHMDQVHLRTNNSYFQQSDSGIWLSSSAPSGDYHITLMHSLDKSNETVHVKVTQLPEYVISEASCRMRIANTTSKSILSTVTNETVTPYEKLKRQLHKHLKRHPASRFVTLDCVSLYAIHDEVDNNVNYTIIRLAVRESPKSTQHLKKEYMTGMLTLSRSALSRETNLQIESIGYDECIKGERVHCNDSCASKLYIKRNTFHLITGDTHSMASVKVYTRAECLCLADYISNTASCEKEAGFCRHRGTCHDSIQGPVCNCNRPYTGPNCELQSHQLDKNSYLWLPPLQTCAKSSLTVEFTTNQSNCLILYNGPMTRTDAKSIPDFVSLELRTGLPRLLINTGSGVSELTLAPPRVNDGHKHRLVIEWINGRIFFFRDNCFNLATASCSNSTTMKGANRYLNVNTPLQLGRVKVKSNVFDNETLHPDLSQSFAGSIEILKFNDFLYDMARSSYTKELLVENEQVPKQFLRYTMIVEPDPVEQERNRLIWIFSIVALIIAVIAVVLFIVWRRCRSHRTDEKSDAKSDTLSKKQFDLETIELSRNMSQVFLNQKKDKPKDAVQMEKLSPSNLQADGVPSNPVSSVANYGQRSVAPPPRSNRLSVLPAPLSGVKWQTYNTDTGAVDTVVPYALEGAYSPGPTLSTIDEIDTFSENDNCHLVDRFVDLVLEHSTASSNDGAEDYV